MDPYVYCSYNLPRLGGMIPMSLTSAPVNPSLVAMPHIVPYARLPHVTTRAPAGS